MSEDKTVLDIKAEKAREKARADQANQEAAQPLDQTVKGGRYLVDGQYVDANGVPLKDNK